MAKVTMRHPQSGIVQQASSDAFERVWQAEGWRLVDTPAEMEPPVEPEVPADPAAMPSDMSVSSTLDWVGDDADRAQVALDAETAEGGKGRATLVARLETLLGD